MLARAGARAGEQRAQRRDGGADAGLVLRLETERLERRHVLAVRPAVDPGPAAGGLHRYLVGAVVAVGAGLPEGRSGGHHEPRVDLAEPLVCDAARLCFARRVVLDEDVGVRGETAEDVATGGPGQGQRDAKPVTV